MVYRYVESGLENVILVNGFKVHKTKYGKGVAIGNTAELHRAIGCWLIEQHKPLNGAELRFLRLEMELTQGGLAAIVGSTKQNVLRWERTRGRAIPGPADRLLRALYAEHAGRNGSLRRLVERLAQFPARPRASNARLRESRGVWKVAA